MPRRRINVAILMVLAVMTVTGGAAYAGSSGPDVGDVVGSSGSSVSEVVWPEGIPRTTPGVTGEFELLRHCRGEDRRDRDCRNEEDEDRIRDEEA